MVEFKGQLTGAAEKRFLKKVADMGQNVFLAMSFLMSPVVIRLSIREHSVIPSSVYLIFVAIILLIARIPKSKKEREAITPKRIYTEENKIVCVAEKYVESRKIADVKCVRDFGEFYELVFPFGKISEKFICQKNLLTKGTLKEFESLFGDKVVRT
jgi:hypothetical protein